MRKQILLMTILLTGLLIVSCEKEDGPLADLAVQEEATTSAADSEVVSLEETPGEASVELRSRTRKIYSKTKYFREGQSYGLLLRKRQMHPGYKYVCKVTPQSGIPNLFIYGVNSGKRAERLFSQTQNTQSAPIDLSAGVADLTREEDFVKFLVEADAPGAFLIEIYKMAGAQADNGNTGRCIRIYDNFDRRRIGAYTNQSNNWRLLGSTRNSIAESPDVVRNPAGRGNVLSWAASKERAIFSPHSTLSQGVYKMRMDLHFSAFSEFVIRFYPTTDLNGTPVVVTIRENFLDVAEGNVCVPDVPIVPSTDGWVRAEITYDADNNKISASLDQGRVYSAIDLNIVREITIADVQARVLPGGNEEDRVIMDNFSFKQEGC